MTNKLRSNESNNENKSRNNVISAPICRLIMIMLFCAALSAATAKAAVYTVTNLDNSGPGSLRQAVIDANATPDDDFITFTVTGTILSAPYFFTVENAGKLTIKGPGANHLTISANNVQYHVFRINSGAEAEISGVTITGTRDSAIVTYGGILTVNDSTIRDNTDIENIGLMGMGIQNNSGTVTVNNSTISGNSTLGGIGGGISSYSGILTINNSTISSNTTYQGGGIYSSNGTVTINNSTISDNSSSQGGGVYLYSTSLTLNNSIVANTTQGVDCFLVSGTVNASYSLIEDGSCGVVNGVNGNLTGDPNVGSLQNNGGPTFTHALLSGSPAIDAGSNSLIPDGMTNDQRGYQRITDGTVDLGAYESAPASFTVNKTADTNDGSCDIFDCSLREAIAAANSASTDDVIIFDIPPGDPGFDQVNNRYTITLIGGDLAITNNGKMVINGPEASQLIVSGNNASCVIRLISQGANLEINRVNIANGRNIDIDGGGIFVFRGGQLTLNNSTISGSSARNGGGIFVFPGGTVTLNNSTISGNSASSNGGGIRNHGTVTLNNSTISGNSAPYGGGISQGRTLNLHNSVVANSTQGVDCVGTVNASYSLVEDGSCGVVNGVNGNLTGDPGLGPLQDNGGPTFTHELLDGSPAIDAGSNDLVPDGMTNDQRGAGFPRIVNSSVDIGAFEKESTNSAPQAADDAYSLDEDDFLTFDVLTNDADGENDPLTAVEVIAPANGSLVSNPDGTFTYTPNANFNGQDSFTYKANDGSLDSAPATVTLTVSEINDRPTATNDDKSTDEDTPFDFNAAELTANDSAGPANESGQTLTVTQIIWTQNTSGQIVLLNGQISYQPDADFSGQASFDYQVCDNGTTGSNPDSKCAVATVNMTVNPINDGPIAYNDAETIEEDGVLNIAAPGVLRNDSDPENDPLTAVLVTGPANGSLTLNSDGSFSYTPDADFNGQDSFVYRVNDGSLDSNPATVSITVSAVNDDPTANNDAATFDEDSQNNPIDVLGNDSFAPDTNETLTVSGVTQPVNGSVSITGDGTGVSYTPDANFFGNDSFTYTISDGNGGTATATVELTISPVNDAPVSDNDSAETDEDTVLNIAAPGVLGNDSDIENDPLAAVLVSNPANGSLGLNPDGSFSYTPNANYYGQDSFTYKANDGSLDSVAAVVSITINAVNDAPSITSGSISRSQAAGSSNSQIASVGDVEDTAGSLSVLVNEAASATSNGVTVSNISIDSNGNVTSDVAAECGATNVSFTLKVIDSGGLVQTAVLNVTVAPETEAPVIDPISDIIAYLPANSSAVSMLVGFPAPTASDNCDSSVTITTSRESNTVFSAGDTIVTVTAVDAAGNTSTATFKVSVRYAFSGFFNPVDEGLNPVKAGRAIPVKFSLSGNKGLNVLAPGYPVSFQIPCAGNGATGEEIPTETAGNSSLTYDSGSDQYKYVWKTDKSWKDSCRRLLVRLNDGSMHTADFRFK